MKDFLPLFPLKMVVYPREFLNLHIFEPRYKQLIRECEENAVTFGIPAFLDQKVMDIGTEIRLVSVENRHQNGELDIKTEGVGLFKIHEFYRVSPNKLYAGADIERIKDETVGDTILNKKIKKNLKILFELLRIDKTIPNTEQNFLTYDIAHHVGFSLEQEYEFLCLPEEILRQEYMSNHLEKLIPIVKEMERLRQKAKLNGHFKDVIPPKV